MSFPVTLGGLFFPSCLMNASGALSTSREELLALARSQSGAIVTKSITLMPFSDPGASCGLENPGCAYYAEFFPELVKYGKPLIASVAGMKVGEYAQLARVLAQAGASMVELNLSNPHVREKVDPFASVKRLQTLLEAVRQEVACPLAVKLPLELPLPFSKAASVLEKTGVGVAVCPSALIRIVKGRLDLIGAGGVSSGKDAWMVLHSGAKAVQIGSSLVREGPSVFARLHQEMVEWNFIRQE